jgi:hypothetical protein
MLPPDELSPAKLVAAGSGVPAPKEKFELSYARRYLWNP